MMPDCKYQLISQNPDDNAIKLPHKIAIKHGLKLSKKFCLTIIFILGIISLVIQSLMDPKNITYLMETQLSRTSYLVYNSKCKILDINPMNSEVKYLIFKKKYIRCTDKPLLSFLTEVNNTIILEINKTLEHQYTKSEVSCCYKTVFRTKSARYATNDFLVRFSKCIPFNYKAKINSSSAILVQCNEKKSKRKIYKNVHAVIKITPSVKKRISSKNYSTKPMSLLLIGVDSVSRLNFIRALPKTKKFLDSNDWLDFKGYNKIEDNTYPNLMAIFTGMNFSLTYEKCNPFNATGLDNCPMIWKMFEKVGYISAFAEDGGNLNTFNYDKYGFDKLPTDYYFRPYILAAETLKVRIVDTMPYCTGPESSGERILNIAKDFAIKFIDHPTFGIYWMNTFSHNNVNRVSAMDEKLLEFFQYITKMGILNNTITVFLSDHGIRFGSIRITNTGWHEERLPFLYMHIPKQFQDSFPEEYKRIFESTEGLMTPYDLHLTFQDILFLQGLNTTQFQPSSACPGCFSLFRKSSTTVIRTCSEAGIPMHYCMCKEYTDITGYNQIVTKSVDYILHYLHTKILKNQDKCNKLSLDKIFNAKIRALDEISSRLVVIFKTKPLAIFEGTIDIVYEPTNIKFNFYGDISRLNFYDDNSECISDSYLKKYCVC